MTKSKTNSVRVGPYYFQPTKYDKEGNLYCMIVKRHAYKKYVNDKCKLTGLYNFDTGEFKIIHVAESWLNHNHQKMLNFFLKEYDWA